jgi:hypothetical protein
MEPPYRSPPSPPHYRLLSTRGPVSIEDQINELARDGYEPLMMAAKGDHEVVYILMVRK